MKIVAVCPALDAGGALEREVCREMECVGGSVTGVGGSVAALAINYCERTGLSYSVQCHASNGDRRYHVRRVETTE